MSVLKEPILKLSRSNGMRSFVSRNRLGRTMARRFVAGETLDDAIVATQELNKSGIHVSLDHLGENTSNPAEAEHATQQYLSLLDRIAQEKLDANISIKLTAMGLDIDPQLCRENVCKVLERAKSYNDTFVRLDMEGSDYTERTLEMFQSLWDEGFRNIGVVLQSYLYRTWDDVAKMIGQETRVRLCKGAYLEPDTVAFADKEKVDTSYIKCMEALLEKGNYPGIATHDQQIIDHALKFVADHKITPERFEFQMLYGVRRDLQKKLVEQGFNVRAYVPYGAEWYPYLMRRMAERPANLIFIMSQFWKG